MIQLYNTQTRQLESFHPLSQNTVRLYACGPTVYNYIHIGNIRTFIMVDNLKRMLKHAGYTVNHVMNITDVGHLTDDGDQGEDKLEKGAKKEGKTAWDIAAFYTNAFLQDISDVNILPPTTLCKATEHIQEQIDQVQQLIANGYTYETTDGIYFDTTKSESYGHLANIKQQSLQAGIRVDMGEKKHQNDFALWKFSKEGETRHMEWDAFGKKGFPGWHIECSAMAMKYLGDQFDIHCGGIDLIPVHHTNEIAQAEAITHKHPWVRFWMHGEFLLVDDKKMAKSDGTFITVQTLKEKGYDPLAYRYLTLQVHYRKQLNFSYEALDAATQGLKRLRNAVKQLPVTSAKNHHLIQEFESAIYHDLNFPEAMAVLWKGINEKSIDQETIITMDKLLGLSLHVHESPAILPDHIVALGDKRVIARAQKQWEQSDILRAEIEAQGYIVEDTKNGQIITSI